MKGLFLAAMLGVWGWLAQPSAASAEVTGVHLEWWRPLGSTCPAGSVLERDVEEALGHPVFTSAVGALLHVRGNVEEDDVSGVVVRLEARSVRGQLLGTRELRAHAGECANLRNDIALVLMLLVEGNGPVPASGAPLRLAVGAWGGIVVHALPRAAWTLGPLLTLDVGSMLQVRADAAYWLPVEIETTRGIRAQLQAASLALRVCPRIAGAGSSPWLLRLCAGAQLGMLIASQSQPLALAAQVRLLSQAVVELRGAIRVGSSASFELALGPSIALTRPSIVSVHSDQERVSLYRPPLLGMMLALAFVL